MVAYKKLTNGERNNIAKKMETIRRNKEITGRIEKLSKEIEDALWDEAPEEVKDFYNKYPQYVNVQNYTLYGFLLFKRDELEQRYIYSSPGFKISKILQNFYNNFNTDNVYLSDTHPLVRHIKANYPELYNKAREIVLDNYKINKWGNNVRCILSTITTLNKLKDEFPEAYEVYESMYTVDKCIKTDKAGKKFNMCDAIEKVRAEFNS